MFGTTLCMFIYQGICEIDTLIRSCRTCLAYDYIPSSIFCTHFQFKTTYSNFVLRFVKDTCYVTGGVSFVGAGTTVLGPHTAVATGPTPRC